MRLATLGLLALSLAACAGAPVEPEASPVAGTPCGDPAAAVETYRLAILARDPARLEPMIAERALQCAPRVYLPRAEVLRYLHDPASQLTAILFHDDLRRSGWLGAPDGWGGLRSDRQILQSPGLVIRLRGWKLGGTLLVDVDLSAPGGASRSMTLECRDERWIIRDWEFTCFMGGARPAP